MKTTKMCLANIQGKMNRAEMKKVMAGSGCGSITLVSYNSYGAPWQSCNYNMTYPSGVTTYIIGNGCIAGMSPGTTTTYC